MNGFIEEVCTQGPLMKEVITFYRNEGLKRIDEIVENFHKKKMNKVILSGMGSSLYAMDAVKSYLTQHGIPALTYSSFELSRFQFEQIDDKTLVIAVSQSGTSAEVIELVEKVKNISEVVGIYNNENSLLSKIVDYPLPICAHKEVSITSKTFEFTMLILNVLAYRLVGECDETFWSELQEVAEWNMKWLENWKENTQSMFEFAQNTQLFDLLANNTSLATARQLSLAYREGLHNCTAVWECADYAHGQYHSSKLGNSYLAQMFFPTFENDTKEMKMLNYILDHGGRVMLYTSTPPKERRNLKIVQLPRFRDSFMPMVESIPAETLLGMLFGSDWVKDH